MNYGELKAQIITDSHRSDLSDEAAYYVQLAEGMIARQVRCAEMLKRVTLGEADRVSEGVYNLPAGFLEARAIYGTHSGRQYELVQVSLAELGDYPSSAPPCVYAISGDTLEFAGVPEEDVEFTLLYFQRPTALSLDSDTNDLLTNHPTLYVHGALFHLFRVTQDFELAQAALDVFEATVNTLNEQAGRHFGSPRIRAGYNLGNGRRRVGY